MAARAEFNRGIGQEPSQNQTWFLNSPRNRFHFESRHPSTAQVRRVIFHADDFGMNTAVNLGILSAFRDGLLTSTSILANAPAAGIACLEWKKLARTHAAGALGSLDKRKQVSEPSLLFDLGIHLNLTQGRPLTGERFPAVLLDPNGNFPGIGKLFARLKIASSAQLMAVKAELFAQVSWLQDQGLRPTHLNGHQYIELIPQVSMMIPEILGHYSIGTVRVALESGLVRNVLFRGDVAGWGVGQVKRHYAKAFRQRMLRTNVTFADRFYGTAHAGRIDRRLISHFLGQSMKVRTTEIGVHPAVSLMSENLPPGDPWFDPLAMWRPTELKWLCDTSLAEELTTRRIGLGRLGML